MRGARDSRRESAERRVDVVRGASVAQLALPAGTLLASLPWDGALADPGKLAAATFLSRL